MIVVNGVRWRILVVPSSHPFLLKKNTIHALGCCDNNTKTIYINSALSEQQKRKVLCHEIVHAFMYSYHVRLGYSEEEKIADIISTYGHSIICLTNLAYAELKQKKYRSFR